MNRKERARREQFVSDSLKALANDLIQARDHARNHPPSYDRALATALFHELVLALRKTFNVMFTRDLGEVREIAHILFYALDSARDLYNDQGLIFYLSRAADRAHELETLL
ncbi:MAG: hypothetical protein JO115_00900 [Pseudonocardiales bacterium]|nr:hypothetical protein [Pseudonocardiales bacterium]